MQQQRSQQKTVGIELIAQHQSVRATYDTGWNAHTQNILSQQHPDDDRVLHWTLEQITINQDDLPF